MDFGACDENYSDRTAAHLEHRAESAFGLSETIHLAEWQTPMVLLAGIGGAITRFGAARLPALPAECNLPLCERSIH